MLHCSKTIANCNFIWTCEIVDIEEDKQIIGIKGVEEAIQGRSRMEDNHRES